MNAVMTSSSGIQAEGQALHSPPRPLTTQLTTSTAAKQAAFEEQSRLKNQFRPLDDDEVDFLAEVRAAKLADEAQLRRETEDGLRHFREAQAEREREAREKEEKERAEDREIEVESEDWGVGRKRKRERGRGLVRGVRRRVSSVSDAGEARKVVESKGPANGGGSAVEKEKEAVAGAVAPVTKPKPKAGLVAYGSDDDDDEDDEDG